METLSGTALALIVGGVLFWTVYAWLSQYNLDRYGDMVENYAWGIGWQWGYSKHPPLFGWITAAWFSVLPRTDIAYYLLSAVNAGVAVAALLMIARRFMAPGRQALMVVIAWILPTFGFLAITYNANAAMLPFWALAALFWVRLVEGQRYADALGLGITLGLAMLAKYHSATLALSLLAWFLMDPKGRQMLATPLPWIAAIASFAVFAPHFVWLVENDFSSITYAAEQDPVSFAGAVFFVGVFALTCLLCCAISLIACLPYRRWRDGAVLFDLSFWPVWMGTALGRATLAFVFGPLLLTVVLGLVMSVQLNTQWLVPLLTGMPLVLAMLLPASRLQARPGLHWKWAATLAIIFLALAPAIKRIVLASPVVYLDAPMRQMARETETIFESRYDTPLTVAGGEQALANALAFYGRTVRFAVANGSFAATPWVSPEEVEASGSVFVCALFNEATCLARAEQYLGRIETTQDLTIDPPEGSGARSTWTFTIHMRGPADASSGVD